MLPGRATPPQQGRNLRHQLPVPTPRSCGSQIMNLKGLIAEVQSIYEGLVMVENKCVQVDTSLQADSKKNLSTDQWQALINLHRTLLHEHYDFLLAIQHPIASEALHRLAAKYSMPARMWRHGIRSFLEPLRPRLPASYEQMLAFIYIAYGIITLLYETVPAFEDAWIECLGDLARYRMAIEETDLWDREVWTDVARSWYSLASEKAPTTGRLYHHLAILARPDAVQQIYFYAKSLCVPVPFPSARESVMTLFEPLLTSSPTKLQPIDASFVRVHAILFSGEQQEQLGPSIDEFVGLLDTHIGAMSKGWLETGYQIGISLACSLLGYGAEDNFLMQVVSKRREQDTGENKKEPEIEDAAKPEAGPDARFAQARSFVAKVYETVAARWGDPNILSFVHTTLVFMYHMLQYPKAVEHLGGAFPWQATATILSHVLDTCESAPRIDGETFPGPLKNDRPRPLPEDFAIRGLVYTKGYFPVSWFEDSALERDEEMFELSSTMDQRRERILWLGRRLASLGWLTWSEETRQFGVGSGEKMLDKH